MIRFNMATQLKKISVKWFELEWRSQNAAKTEIVLRFNFKK